MTDNGDIGHRHQWHAYVGDNSGKSYLLNLFIYRIHGAKVRIIRENFMSKNILKKLHV